MAITNKPKAGLYHNLAYCRVLSKALKNLELQHDNYKNLDDELPELMKEAVSESVIQRFEICYDTMWKILKRHLQEVLGLAEVPNSPRPILRLADSNNLLSSPFSQWDQYIQARIDTTHDYSGEKAKKALGIVGNFIDDAIDLYQTLTEETWE